MTDVGSCIIGLVEVTDLITGAITSQNAATQKILETMHMAASGANTADMFAGLQFGTAETSKLADTVEASHESLFHLTALLTKEIDTILQELTEKTKKARSYKYRVETASQSPEQSAPGRSFGDLSATG
jgi:hypothetical protein